MKKILLLMIMLCTAMSAWSYETENFVLKFNDDTPSEIITNPGTGISVQGTLYTEDYPLITSAWKVDKDNALVLSVPQGYVITGVEFEYSGFIYGDCIDQCECLIFDAKNGTWVQNEGKLDYFNTINFKAKSPAYVSAVIVYYHKHTLTNHEAVAATCSKTGMREYWKCECGKIYSDNACNNEVTDMASLETDIDPNNHINTTHEDGIPATCGRPGERERWVCDACGGSFEGPDCNVVVDPVSPIDPKNHESELTEHEAKAATCISDGNIHYWHCDACGKNFKEEACTTQITEVVVIPAINHKNKEFNEAVAPTTETTGNVAYWYCPDCDKHFGDEGCTKELTEWILEKLMNMMHLDFAGTSVPIEAEHYLNTTKFNFTDGGDIILTVNDESVTYDKEMINKVQFSNGTPGVKISANEDPDNKGTYYSTFYSSLESYAVPEGFTAYRGEISDDGTKLTLTSVGDGVMTRGEGYILKGTASSGNMNVTANAGSSSDNKLQGTDVAIASLGANDYALSHGSNGVGFYLWSGKNIGANKAYLELPASSVKAFTFEFEEATGIHNSQFIIHNSENDEMYNLNGVRVDENYKGIVIKNGKKVYQR